ncbi:hypothetical protein CCZ01_06910 [Helicobacter monodelphidis]|uniref:GGDEF domain-containing protein n=1 Tax=Helicobacter sp. 15-1451 TaxID=2004995 RepID=UPI000DCD9F58|nr:GGDEF domain-containing protein [Helicobacter sp. 15-1451]RAX57188.1 hypothetical protein CCZ01_06910 [Helicobacter sp. 15-1451]
MFKKVGYKFFFILITTLVLFSFFVLTTIALSIREVGIRNAKQSAFTIAEIVHKELNASTNIQLQEYLNRLLENPKIRGIWIDTIEEKDKNPLLKKVFATKKRQSRVIEHFSQIYVSVSLPHLSESNEVQFVISVEFDVSEIRSQWLEMIVLVIFLVLFFIGATLFILRQLFAPYRKFYDDLQEIVLDTQKGFYEKRIQTKLQDEVGDIAHWINGINEGVSTIAKSIEARIPILINYKKEYYSQSLLERIEEVMSDLVDLYEFKKGIEHLDDRNDIEQMIISLFNQFHIYEFIIIEIIGEKQRLVHPLNAVGIFEKYQQIINKKSISSKQLLYESEYGVTKFFKESISPTESCIIGLFEISNKIRWNLIFIFEDSSVQEDFIQHLTTFCNYFDAARASLQARYLTDILKENSRKDPLTQLYNRTFLEEYSASATSQAKRINVSYGVLMVDIDFFKKVNDTYGHNIGDKVLVELARVFTQNIRESDIAVRYGGEEFLILLFNSNKEGSMHVAQNIKKHFEEIIFESDNGEKFGKTLSIGICLFPNKAQSIALAIKYADIALYRAKEGGRNRIVEFMPDMLPKDFNPTKV